MLRMLGEAEGCRALSVRAPVSMWHMRAEDRGGSSQRTQVPSVSHAHRTNRRNCASAAACPLRAAGRSPVGRAVTCSTHTSPCRRCSSFEVMPRATCPRDSPFVGRVRALPFGPRAPEILELRRTRRMNSKANVVPIIRCAPAMADTHAETAGAGTSGA